MLNLLNTELTDQILNKIPKILTVTIIEYIYTADEFEETAVSQQLNILSGHRTVYSSFSTVSIVDLHILKQESNYLV